MVPRAFLAPFEDIHLRYLLFQRDIAAQSGNDTQPYVILQAAPFNRLGVWAYIAFGFIILAASTVLSYMIYSCCYSAQQRQRYYSTNTRADRRKGAVRIASMKRTLSRNLDNPGNNALPTISRIGNVKEKPQTNRDKVSKAILRMQAVVLMPDDRHLNPSESSRNIIPSHPPTTKCSFSNTHDRSLDSEGQWPSVPPLAHTSDMAAPYIPFHLPPPPSSPTPAHKELVEQQRYRRHSAHQSPASPSPSYFPDDSLPSLTNESILGIPRRHAKPRLRGSAAAGAENANANKATEPASEFDSNNIRFMAPRNPFMTPSNALLWNEPKLSPIGGAIISPSPPLSMAAGPESNPFVQAVWPRSAEYDPAPVTPVHDATRKARLLSPNVKARGGGSNPISRPGHGQGNTVERDNRF